MRTDDRLGRNWRQRLATHPFSPRLALLDAGFVLGAGTVLAPMLETAGSHAGIDLDRDHDRIVALLALVHYGHLPVVSQFECRLTTSPGHSARSPSVPKTAIRKRRTFPVSPSASADFGKRQSGTEFGKA